jgi:hypothetical protein
MTEGIEVLEVSDSHLMAGNHVCCAHSFGLALYAIVSTIRQFKPYVNSLTTQYNIWYNKYVGEQYQQSGLGKDPAPTRCYPDHDAGELGCIGTCASGWLILRGFNQSRLHEGFIEHDGKVVLLHPLCARHVVRTVLSAIYLPVQTVVLWFAAVVVWSAPTITTSPQQWTTASWR